MPNPSPNLHSELVVDLEFKGIFLQPALPHRFLSILKAKEIKRIRGEILKKFHETVNWSKTDWTKSPIMDNKNPIMDNRNASVSSKNAEGIR